MYFARRYSEHVYGRLQKSLCIYNALNACRLVWALDGGIECCGWNPQSTCSSARANGLFLCVAVLHTQYTIYTYIKSVFVQYDFAIALNHAETRLHGTCFSVLLVCRVRVVSSISVSLCPMYICTINAFRYGTESCTRSSWLFVHTMLMLISRLRKTTHTLNTHFNKKPPHL